MNAPAALILPDWPACLDLDGAIRYSGLAPSEIAKAARDGRLNFKAIGPRGRKVCRRMELDALLAHIWAEATGEPLDDMDFGADGDD